MRIIAGEKRGLVLKSINAPGLRPTSGRIRESLFGMLAPYIEGALALDLFAGSGALGLEALSRGAKSVLFVEKSRQAVKVIEDNIVKTGYNERSQVAHTDFIAVGSKIAIGKQFDLIFSDPPYRQDLQPQVINQVVARSLLTARGRLVVELDRHDTGFMPDSALEIEREKKYGSTIIWILRRAE